MSQITLYHDNNISSQCYQCACAVVQYINLDTVLTIKGTYDSVMMKYLWASHLLIAAVVFSRAAECKSQLAILAGSR